MTFYIKRIYFFGNLNFLRPIGKLKSIFYLAENLSLVLTKLDTELGLAQPQLVSIFNYMMILFLFQESVGGLFMMLQIKTPIDL